MQSLFLILTANWWLADRILRVCVVERDALLCELHGTVFIPVAAGLRGLFSLVI